MASTAEINAVADALYAAYTTLEPVAPPRETIAGLDLNGAYAIQLCRERVFEAAGHTVVGRKIGLTSLAMQQQLGSGATFDDVVASIGSIHRAVEIIDSRIRDWDITLVDTVADNASCGAVVIDPEPIDVAIERLGDVPAELSIDGRVTGSGVGTAVMGHPLRPLEWLANVLGEMGVPLRAGQVILTGSFCSAAPVHAGQKAAVDYGPYGALEIEFV